MSKYFASRIDNGVAEFRRVLVFDYLFPDLLRHFESIATVQTARNSRLAKGLACIQHRSRHAQVYVTEIVFFIEVVERAASKYLGRVAIGCCACSQPLDRGLRLDWLSDALSDYTQRSFARLGGSFRSARQNFFCGLLRSHHGIVVRTCIADLLRQENDRTKGSDPCKPSARGRKPVAQAVFVRGARTPAAHYRRCTEYENAEGSDYYCRTKPPHHLVTRSDIHKASWIVARRLDGACNPLQVGRA